MVDVTFFHPFRTSSRLRTQGIVPGMEGRIVAAWVTGWLVYMVAMIVTVYDGIGSLICQPFVGALVSTIVLLCSLALGLILHVKPIGRIWNSTWMFAAILLFAGLLVLCFGTKLGLAVEFTHPELGETVVGLQAEIAFAAYLAIMFSVANWPDGE